ncbi:5'-deoxyadenosine deaminase [Candidatus Methanoperedenaceae archaeon GB37]|nr:5'-deoxyadenosine deaminase [Candidatus Methanoperedenaceae archaeon GB37]
MSTSVIRGGHLLLPDGRLLRRDLLIEDGLIASIGVSSRCKDAIDATGCLVMPGFVNTHTHTPMTLLRGWCEGLRFSEWLECIWQREAELTPSDVYLGSILACVEMIRSGITTFADVYIHMDRVALAAGESGLRCVLGWGLLEGAGGEPLEEKLSERRAFVKKYNHACNGRITTMYAPHSPVTSSEEALTALARLSREDGVPITTHLLESREEAMALDGSRHHLSRLDRAGLLSNRFLAAHCVHLSDEDARILAERGVSVSLNPISNLRLGVGVPPIEMMASHGLNLSLGTDGAASGGSLDIFEVMRTVALIGRMTGGISPSNILRMATLNGAVALGLETGAIKRGFAADLILVDMKKPHLTGCDPISALVHSARGCDVKTTIVEGEVLMEDYVIKTLNEEDIIERAIERIADLKNMHAIE